MTLNRRPSAKPSTPIYMTPACARRLRAELKELLYKLRPEMVNTAAWAAGNGDRSENADYQYAKRRLRQYDSRIRFLSKRLENAAIVDPVEQGKTANGRVLFGATVTVENSYGVEKVYSIVGEDEFDPVRGYVSWKSPVGRALLGKREGDEVVFTTPGGRVELEIVQVDYRALV
ncbi:MAG TPA: transcription elongation factor GreB [Desulfobacterales bacterium]|nr:transcription elongation factor GreB [Desulfobacterales bacterium]